MINTVEKVDSELNRITRDIDFLSSPELSGRLSGTEGAKKTADFLAGRLRELGYSPAGTEGYFSRVNVSATRFAGPARLKIGQTAYRHRVDFAELTPHSAAGKVKAKLVVIKDGEEFNPNELNNNVVLIPERPEGFDIKGTIQSAIDYGVKALVVEAGDPRWFHKSIHSSSDNKIPVIRLKKSITQTLIDQKNINVELEMPLSTGSLPCQNVLGIRDGKNSDKTLLLSAHYDHLGDDPDGVRFPGSIDNASGVAIMLEIARQLSTQELPFNVLFGFFTGEESGLVGAKAFVSNPPVPIHAVINLDSLGFEPELRAARTGHKEPGLWLADMAAKVIASNGIEVRWIAGGEDSMAFTAKGIPAVGIGQKPTLKDSITIHTGEDNPNSIYHKPIVQGLKVVSGMIDSLTLREKWV